jgi:hypothetical protein
MGKSQHQDPGPGIWDEQPGSYFLELGNHFFAFLMRIRDPGWKKVSPMLMKLFSTLFLARLLLWHDVPPIQGHTDRGCSSSSHPPIQRTLLSRIQKELTHALNRP